jgi:hypothetical protein
MGGLYNTHEGMINAHKTSFAKPEGKRLLGIPRGV